MPTTNLRNSTHVTGTAPDNTMTIDTPNAVPAIVADKWIRAIKEKRSDKEKKDKEVETAQVKGNVKISLETQNVADDTELTISLLDAGDNSELTTVKVKLKKNKGDTENIEIKNDWYNKELIVSVTKDNNSNLGETYTGTKKLKISCCEHAIVRGDEGDLIKEINIRLAGFGEFGCPLPQSLFDERTEKAVKQFQRDYMKVNQTGIICKDFLEKLDQFCEDYYIKIDTDKNVKCPCVTQTKTTGEDVNHRCSGFGLGRASLESPRKRGPEKPGIHRSLLWGFSAMKFYLDKVETTDGIAFKEFSSTYRCIADNIRHTRNTTNHMGNAVDIQFLGSSGTLPTRADADKVRELFAIYCGAKIRWKNSNSNFCMEPSIAAYYSTKKVTRDDPANPGKKIVEEVRASDEYIASTWVHVDCREFEDDYQKDEFYCKTETALKGTSFFNGNLVETSDAEKYKNIKDCTYKPEVKDKRERTERLWLGIIKDAYLLDFSNGNTDSDKKWTVKYTSIPAKSKTNASKPRIQEIVTILEENATQYKIIPRGDKKEGWIEKKYIKQICKYEKDK